MRTHETISGREVSYPEPDQKLERFLRRVQALTDDPKVTEAELIALIYGEENPILERGVLPGRPAVTKAVLENPVYQVLADLLVRKTFQVRGTDPVKVGAKFTITVGEAAERKGVSPDAIRKAIREWRLPAWKRGGEYFLEDKSLEALEVVPRGPAPTHAEPLQVHTGYDAETRSFLKLHVGPGGEKPKFSTDVDSPVSQVSKKHKGSLSRWRRIGVYTAGLGGSARFFEIEPAETEEKIDFQGFFVRGKFRFVRKVNSAKAAREAWEEFKAS